MRQKLTDPNEYEHEAVSDSVFAVTDLDHRILMLTSAVAQEPTHLKHNDQVGGLFNSRPPRCKLYVRRYITE